jgi:hypothetical protein
MPAIFVVVASCILIKLKFLSPTDAPFVVHGTQYTPELETLFTTILLNI